MAPKLAWVLACAFLQVVVTTANEQHLSSHLLIKREFFPAENKALQQVSYRQMLSKSPVICVSYCHSDPNCRSVSYINNQLCELHNETRTQYPDDFKTLYGSWYYDGDLDTPLFSQADIPLLSVSLNNSNSDSCQKLLEAGTSASGVYTIYPDGFSEGLQVYCDMETDGGGWIVIQRRQDGSVSFDRNWNAYRDGFGSPSGEFWLGNNALRILTESSGNWLLRVNLQDWEDQTAWSKYSGFKMTGTYFTLNFNSYDDASTAGDSLNYHQGKPFSTPDRDRDNDYLTNCALRYNAGWWFHKCHASLLNGQYYGEGSQQPRNTGYGIQWDSWRGDPYSLKSCTMEIKISSIPLYSSCEELLKEGNETMSGVYTIFPAGSNDGMQVYCDMESAGGGWIVIQRRLDGSVTFDRSWNDYRAGFGDLTKEFWLGNDDIRTLTESVATWTLRVDLMDWNELTAWSEYSGFQITGSYYNLKYSSFDQKSTAGDSLVYHRGSPFSTPDKDNDAYFSNCAYMYRAGWWFKDCHQALLNGQYYPFRFISKHGVQWDTWRDDPYSLKECSMKIRSLPLPNSRSYSSCTQLLEAGFGVSGIYTIFPAGFSGGLEVYCDMETDGGGWIVFQRRQDGLENFYRSWNDYRAGFGSLSSEFWLGNENLRILTESVLTWRLRVDLQDWNNERAWAIYSGFQITGNYYTLQYNSYETGLSTAGNTDSLLVHKGMPFSTGDRDSDRSYLRNCAGMYKGGWWFNDCHFSLLNGQYYQYTSYFPYAHGVQWNYWRQYPYSLKSCSMKIKDIQNTN